MEKTSVKSRKCAFQIEHNGIIYRIGDTTMREAQKKVHQFVRKWIIKEWSLRRQNCETTATLIADGKKVGSAFAYHKNRSIHVILSN